MYYMCVLSHTLSFFLYFTQCFLHHPLWIFNTPSVQKTRIESTCCLYFSVNSWKEVEVKLAAFLWKMWEIKRTLYGRLSFSRPQRDVVVLFWIFEFVEFYKVVDSAPWYSLPLNITVISLACVAMAMTFGANKKNHKIWEQIIAQMLHWRIWFYRILYDRGQW